MASIVYQKDKRSGITYAYESVSHWDKVKKQSRAKRTLVGRVDAETGEIIPTDGCNKQKSESKLATKRGPVAADHTARLFYGATYLLDAVADKLGIAKDLKDIFPDSYKQIMSIVYYLIIEDNSPLF